eukprot:TRINITY_DN115576_c0_g1_i1.p3 TRINITY_DN115576_c0_g1~~TRINITY_DN115576_c0_g1_i1.p3  ORF type:complete len:103 (-),score=18.84 TRINITY_DN115576_c0_g1_i1:71-379(-)
MAKTYGRFLSRHRALLKRRARAASEEALVDSCMSCVLADAAAGELRVQLGRLGAEGRQLLAEALAKSRAALVAKLSRKGGGLVSLSRDEVRQAFEPLRKPKL